MLIVPTSLDTALVFQLEYPLVLGALGSASFMAAAYCLSEMLTSAALGNRPRTSRWLWLGGAGALVMSAMASSALLLDSVTFNADGTGWVSTSWGYLLGGYLMAGAGACSMVVAVLRAIDAVETGRNRSRRHMIGWVFGLCTAVTFGLLLALGGDGAYEPGTDAILLVAGLALAIIGVGSPAAAAALRLMRLRQSVTVPSERV